MVTVKVIGLPRHKFVDDGVTVIVPVIFMPVEFAGAFHELMFPEPDPTSPINVLLLVHVYVVPIILLANTGIFMVAPGQTEIELTLLIVGVEGTETVKVIADPTHPN